MFEKEQCRLSSGKERQVIVWKGKASYCAEGQVIGKSSCLEGQIDERLDCDSEVDIGVLIDCFGQEFRYFIGV